MCQSGGGEGHLFTTFKDIYTSNENSGSIYHFTPIRSQNRFLSLEGIIIIIDFFETTDKNTVVQPGEKRSSTP